jgi:hypothetical protein
LHQIRTILVAILALCLAVFPAGMSRASAPMPETVAEASHQHVHAPGAAAHDHDGAHEAAVAKGGHSHSAMAGADHDCSGHGKDGKHCASTCCGLGCHAFQIVFEPALAAQHSYLIQRTATHDDQVGGGLPFSIERPPRFL